MKGHIESVAQSGACLDRNLQAGNIVDTYQCCVDPACVQMNEEWNLSSVASGRFISAANGECVTEGATAASGGSGSYVALHSPDGKDHTVVIETMVNGDSTCFYGNSGWDDIVVGTHPNPVRVCLGNNESACLFFSLSLFYSNFNQSVRFEKQTPLSLDTVRALDRAARIRQGAARLEAPVSCPRGRAARAHHALGPRIRGGRLAGRR